MLLRSATVRCCMLRWKGGVVHRPVARMEQLRTLLFVEKSEGDETDPVQQQRIEQAAEQERILKQEAEDEAKEAPECRASGDASYYTSEDMDEGQMDCKADGKDEC